MMNIKNKLQNGTYVANGEVGIVVDIDDGTITMEFAEGTIIIGDPKRNFAHVTP